jgi:hypothetical protein
MQAHLNACHPKVRSIQVAVVVVRQDLLIVENGAVDYGFSRDKRQAACIVLHYGCLLRARYGHQTLRFLSVCCF